MTASSLSSALRAGAEVLYAPEVTTELIVHGAWLERNDAVRIP
jgi:hypothetical protein